VDGSGYRYGDADTHHNGIATADLDVNAHRDANENSFSHTQRHTSAQPNTDGYAYSILDPNIDAHTNGFIDSDDLSDPLGDFFSALYSHTFVHQNYDQDAYP
jgi:hypothetical protein